MRYRNPINRVLALGIMCLCLSCSRSDSPTADQVHVDLDEIRQRDTLIAISTYSTTSYFIYRGQPMGYEYDLLTRLANYLGLELRIKIGENLDHLDEMLLAGEGDIIAHGMTITRERKRVMAFTEPHLITKQVLVQRLPDNWRQMKLHEIADSLIRNPLDLLGKTVHVRRNSSYYERLVNLSEEMGGTINIKEVPGDLTTEELIRKVAEGEIKYTVADQNIASINKTYYDNLDIKTELSFPQRIAWAVRKSSPELLKAINTWIDSMKQTSDYYVIYNKYFRNRKAQRRRVRSDFFSATGGRISRWDDLLRARAAELGWDWRLLASMVYQESQFRPQTRSWAGATGLMQMMPAIARKFGVENLSDPVQSLEAGTDYLAYLQSLYHDIDDTLQRIKFVLASYNVGENHIADARRLADKYGDDPNRWDDNVEDWVLKLSKPKFYNDEVVNYGYARGEEPYHYVTEILERYEHYKTLIPVDVAAKPDSL